MQRHYVMVSLHIWTNRCKPLQQFSFMSICPDEKWSNLQQGFASTKLRRKTVGPIFSPMNPFQYYEMSYGLNVEMHKQVMHPHKIIQI